MQAPSESIRVLHVDDEPDFVELASTFLEREDDRFDITTATSVSEGGDQLASGDFDCVVSDFDMPGANGIEFLETVREEYPDLPFILYTGKGSEEVASDAISAGVTDYLQKSGGTDQYAILANRISNAVEAHRTARQSDHRRHRLEQILKTVPGCVVQLDSDGRFIYANQRAEEVLGLESSGVTERTYNDPDWQIRDLNGEPIPDENLPFRQVLDSGEPLYGFRHTIQWSDGTEKVLLVNGSPLFDDRGAVENVIFSLIDITDRLQRERELEQYEAYLQNSTDIITVLDESGTIKYQSPSVTRVLGYERRELIGENGFDYVHPDDVDATFESFRDLVADPGATVTVECRFRTADDEWCWLEVRGTNQLDDPTIEGVVTNNRDITERKAREQALERQNERLEAFTDIVSHDLRTRLNTANELVELAREECDSDHLDRLDRVNNRMRTLIEDLLTLAREDDRIGAVESVGVAEVVTDCWDNVETADATLVVRTDVTITADRSRMRQLTENLIRNAIEHGGDDVTVTVGDLEGGFYVEDDGVGIPDDHFDQVFDTGFSSTASGTGLGLAIVRAIAKAHGWTVEIMHGSDGGVRFEFTGVDEGE